MLVINNTCFQKGCKNNFFLIDLLHSDKNRCKLIDFQLILNKKKYKYNPNTLLYEINVVPFKVILNKFLRFVGISSAFAILLSVLFFLFFGSPIEQVLKGRISHLKGNYTTLNNTIDTLQANLEKKLFSGDKFYRELLELDSLSISERTAGIGGSERELELQNYPNNKIITTTAENLTRLKKQIEVQDKSFQKIFTEAIIYNNELTYIPAIQPVKPADNIWISSYFGYRNDPFLKHKKRHNGLDFVGPKNTKIYATADGKVKITKESNRGYGKEIIILHKFGYSTRYAHLNSILVKSGQEVKRGELIGLMGSTGRSTGMHLHYEVLLNGRYINPLHFFSDDLSEQEYQLITSLSENDKVE